MSEPAAPHWRLAGPRDAQRLAGLHGLLFPGAGWSPGFWTPFLAERAGLALLLLAGSAPGGLAAARITAGEAEILTFGIAPDLRRAGHGGRLLRATLDALRDREADTVFLEVSHLNVGADTLYRGHGFVQVGRRAKYYPDRSDAVVMRRDLSLAPPMR